MARSWRLIAWLGVTVWGCGDGCGSQAAPPDSAPPNSALPASDPSSPDPGEPSDPEARAAAARQAQLDASFPLHGLVTGTQLRVRGEPDPEAGVRGWLRMGSRVRLSAGPRRTATCSSGWYPIFPSGWICAGEGVEIAESPLTSALALNPPPKDAPLPYDYYFVKEDLVPEYHRLPSRNEQRATTGFVQRYGELRRQHEKLAERMWQGALPKEPASPAVVRTYLKRGFFVASAGIEVRASRRFVRTVRGSYIKEAQLERRVGSEFRGVELNEDQRLPVAWAIRAARPFHVHARDDGSHAFVADESAEPIPRLGQVAWAGRERVGSHILHKLQDGRYLKHWFVAVAEPIDPPSAIADGEPWVHVNLDQQTLVLYEGKRPRFATLISSGIDAHETPEGIFGIRAKHLADTMANLGPEAGDDSYRVEDVPWTHYFQGSLALHGAFWHDRFGMPRSHGCINLAPHDARRVFEHTLPHVEDGWHGVSTDRTGLTGSKVVITR